MCILGGTYVAVEFFCPAYERDGASRNMKKHEGNLMSISECQFEYFEPPGKQHVPRSRVWVEDPEIPESNLFAPDYYMAEF